VDEKYVSKTFQRLIADTDNELKLDDAVKITGCWNGLAKRIDQSATPADLEGDVSHMRRAVAFSRSIKDSKAFVENSARSSPNTGPSIPTRKTCSTVNSTMWTAPLPP
jgi:predicted helicase